MKTQTAKHPNYKAMWEQDRMMFLQAVGDLNLSASATPETIAAAIRRLKTDRDALRLDLVAARDLVSACEIPHMLAQMKQEFECALELFARANKAKRQARRECNAAQARSGAASAGVEYWKQRAEKAEKDARQILKYAWHDETCNGDTMDCDCGLTKWTKKYGGANVK